MSPEFPFILSGALILIGGTIENNGYPKNGIRSLIGTLILALVASATNNTPVAPMVRAIGLLYLLAAAMRTVKVIDSAKDKKND